MFKCSIFCSVPLKMGRVTGTEPSSAHDWAGRYTSRNLFATAQRRHENETVVLVIWMFWLHFCTLGRRGDTSSIFIYVSVCDTPPSIGYPHHTSLSLQLRCLSLPSANDGWVSGELNANFSPRGHPFVSLIFFLEQTITLSKHK